MCRSRWEPRNRRSSSQHTVVRGRALLRRELPGYVLCAPTFFRFGCCGAHEYRYDCYPGIDTVFSSRSRPLLPRGSFEALAVETAGVFNSFRSRVVIPTVVGKA